jgi:chromosome segregation ATPase
MLRMTSKHQTEISDLKYQLQELEMSKKDLQNEINLLKARQSEEDSIEELRTNISQLRTKLEQEERRCEVVLEENDRLKDDLLLVSLLIGLFAPIYSQYINKTTSCYGK